MHVCVCVRACVHAHNDRNEINTLVVQCNLTKFPAGPKFDRQYAEFKHSGKREFTAYRLRCIVKKKFSSEMEKAVSFPVRVFRGISWQISQIFHLVEKYTSCETHISDIFILKMFSRQRENIFESEENSIQ